MYGAVKRHHLPQLSAICLALLVGIALIGCPGPSGPQPEGGDGISETPPPAFNWDTTRRAPRWRANSPIEWHRTHERDAVLQESRSSGKPVFCYISRYDSDLTETIEDGLFSSETWGPRISSDFVAWEIDWWEAPALAQSILGSRQAPAIAVLMGLPDESSDDSGIIDLWTGRELLAFPLHDGPTPVDSPEAEAAIAMFAEKSWEDVVPVGLVRSEIDADAFAEGRLRKIADDLDGGMGVMPDDVLYAAWGNVGDDELLSQMERRVSSWGPYIAEIDEDIVWMPDEAFVPGAGWCVDPFRNLEACICSIALGVDWPIDIEKTMSAVGSMIVLQDGLPGGGFPAYLDIRNTFREGGQYAGDDISHAEEALQNLSDPVTGPRDIVWVNARMFARLFRLIGMSEDVAAFQIADGMTLGDFANESGSLIIRDLLERAGDPEAMSLPDRIYLIDLLIQIYQLTADVSLLEKAGEIAEVFDPEHPEDWLEPSMYFFMPDLALVLHYYGWLAENEGAREASRLITEEAVGYSTGFPESDQNRLAFAHDVVHSKCLHIAVVASLDDPVGRELLMTSLRGWEPTLVAQLVDPERDKDLIEKKGYMASEDATAYVCVDDMCYMPSYTTNKLEETIEGAIEDMHNKEPEG